MELEFYERYSRLTSRGGSAVLQIRLPHLRGGSNAMEECYQKAADALEVFAKGEWQEQLDREFSQSDRQSRLHRIEPRMQFTCQGVLVEDRYVSLALTFIKRSRWENMQLQSYRVWDGREGRLCPIELFLSKKEGKAYHRWSFHLRDEEVLGFPRKHRSDEEERSVCVGKRKIFSLPIDKNGRVC